MSTKKTQPKTEQQEAVVEQQTTPEEKVIEPEATVEEQPKLVILPEDRPFDEIIVEYMEGKGEMEMNGFLKSLFGLPKPNQPPKYLEKTSSNKLRAVLTDLVNQGKLSIVSQSHRRLGMPHYPDETGRTHYWNLDTMKIIGRLL